MPDPQTPDKTVAILLDGVELGLGTELPTGTIGSPTGEPIGPDKTVAILVNGLPVSASNPLPVTST